MPERRTVAAMKATPTPDSPAGHLLAARAWARQAQARGSLQAWVNCGVHAWRALALGDVELARAAAELATQGATEVLARVLRHQPDGCTAGPMRVGDVALQVEFRRISPSLQAPLRMRAAQDVSMDAFAGKRHARSGFGAPVAALSAARAASSFARLVPRSGAFGNLTAWIEPGNEAGDATPRLVFADPQKLDALVIGTRRLPLARDTSAAYAWGMQLSKLERSGLWGLMGGEEIARRAGLYLLEDYDPGKRPLVMIHGLGSNPLIWSHVSNAVWGDEELRTRFQIWQVVYRSDAPLLAARLHVQDYLDDAWRLLDPDDHARSRCDAVLVGHSLGGVIARLLCADSGDVLWKAAFVVPPEALDADPDDLATVRRIFIFHPCAGIARAVFLAAPHRGSPSAGTVLGRLTGELIGRRTIEVHALRRIALRNPHAIRPELLEVFEQGSINSITTLHSGQPVRRAAESLMPPAGFPFHTIAGVLPGRRAQNDGVVPLDSALLPGAASSLVVESGHRVHEHPQAVAEVVRILHEHVSAPSSAHAPGR